MANVRRYATIAANRYTLFSNKGAWSRFYDRFADRDWWLDFFKPR